MEPIGCTEGWKGGTVGVPAMTEYLSLCAVIFVFGMLIGFGAGDSL